MQGAKPVKATDKGKGRGKRSTKRQNDTTTDPATLGQLPVTECAVGGTEVEGENEGFHSPLIPDPPVVVEQEQEISVDISDLLGSTILGFQPLNPGNSTERRPDHYLPIYTSTPARGHSIVTGKDVLWISGLRPEFPMINNSMEGTGQRNSVFNIHLELGPFGYELTRGDIVRFFPLNNQANKESKIPTVVVYKSREITSKVIEAAKAAGLWGSRAAKINDRPGDRNGYFRAPANIRRKFTPRK